MWRTAFVVMILTPALAAGAAFQSTTPLPEAFYGHVTVAYNNFIYKIGGIGDQDGVLAGNTVYYASINSDGSLGQWKATTPLPTYLFFHTGTVVNGFIYIIGGDNYDVNNGFLTSNLVFYAKIQADGTVSAWNSGPNLPQAVAFPSATSSVNWNNVIYVTGGLTDTAETNSVYFITVNSDGSMGTWTATTPLPVGLYTHTTVQQGNIYVIGGATNNGSIIVNSVYRAPVNSDKTLGAWTAVTSLPTPLSLHNSQLWGNTIYVTGGFDGTNVLNTVYTNVIQTDGSLASWLSGTPLPATLKQHGAAAISNYLYITGGQDNSGTAQSAVYYMPLPPVTVTPTDVLPPRTTLSVGSPNLAGSPEFVSAATLMTLSAVDDLTAVGDGKGVGVQNTFWSLDSNAFNTYSAPFSIGPDGLHWLRYYSVDKIGNTEATQAAQFAVDGTAPVSNVSIGSPQATLTSGGVVVSSLTVLAISATDPAVNGVASGVLKVLYGVDGSLLAPQSGPFTLPAVDGSHTVQTQAFDNVQNAEAAHNTAIFLDATPPATTIQAAPAPFVASNGTAYLSAASLVSFTANDPVKNGVASGVNHTEYSVDGSLVKTFAGAFGLPEGAHALSYRSFDNVGNAESSKAASYSVDSTPPMSTLTVGAPAATLFGMDFVTTASQFSISAQDPISNGVASGIAHTFYNIDGAADQTYTAAFSLAAGQHTISYGSVDNAGNAETRQSVVVYVSPFLTDLFEAGDSISLAGQASLTGTLRTNGLFTETQASSVTGDVFAMTASISANSTVTGAVSQGAATLPARPDLTAARNSAASSNNNSSVPAAFISNGSLNIPANQTLALAAGGYSFNGISIGAGASLSAAGRVSIFSHGAVSLGSGASVNGGGDPNNFWIALDTGDFSMSAGAQIAGNIVGPASNASLVGNGSFSGRILGKTVSMINIFDVLPPRTTLQAGAPNYGSSPEFLTPSTLLTLSAVDDAVTVGDGKGAGVQSTQWALDNNAYTNYSTAFSIGPDGMHWVRFFSADKIGNIEAVQAVQFAVDGTVPVSSVTVGSPQTVLASGAMLVSPLTSLAVSAVDPLVNGVASGLAQLQYGIDAGAMIPAAGTFQLPSTDGAHTVRTQAADNLGNTETAHTLTVYVDATAPQTTIQPSPAPFVASNGTAYLNASASIAFSAVDPVAGGVAAGVNHTEYTLDGGAAATYGGPFGLSEGAHSISYRSIDNVANAEAMKSANYSVDATPPLTTLSLNGGVTLFGTDIVTTDTSFTLTAQDPASNGVASGVSRILYSIDGAADQVYAAAFHLTVGAHTINFGAVDNAGNAEVRRTVSISVGTFLSDTLAATDSVTLSGGAGVNGNVRTNGSFTGSGKSYVNGNVAAMAVNLNGKSTISGTVTQGQATLATSSFDLTAASAWAQANNNNANIPSQFISAGALVIDSQQQLILPDGNYYFTGISITGGASVSVTNHANLFVHGTITLAGGGKLNDTGDANNLWIVSDSGDVDLSGHGRGAFNLYAPAANVTLSGSDLYAGRVLGKTVALSGHATQASNTVLPPPTHGPGSTKHLAKADDQSGSGTEGNGHSDGKDQTVFLSLLTVRSPSSRPVSHNGSLGTPPATPALARAHIAGGSTSAFHAQKPSSGSGSVSHSTPVTHLPVPAPLVANSVGTPANAGSQTLAVTTSCLTVALPTQTVTAAILSAPMPPAPPFLPGSHGSTSNAVKTANATKNSFEAHLPKVASLAQIPPSGGTVQVDGNGSVTIPDQAAQGLKVSVTRHLGSDSDEPARIAKMAAKGLAAASPGTEFGPEGTQFNRPVTITLAYDRTLVPNGSVEDNLSIYYWNPAKQDWEAFTSQVDKVHQTVSAQTTHFSLYRVMAGGAAPAASGGAPFALGSVYSFPNPATRGTPATIHIEAGSADEVDIHVYDLSGRLVHSASVSGPAPLVDDGSGRGPVPAFEYSWDVHGVGSGVYSYLITANKAGAGSLKAKGKIVVIK